MYTYVNYGEWALDQAISEGIEGIRCDEVNGLQPPELVPLFLDKPIRPLFLLHDVAKNAALLDAIIPVQDRLLEPAIEIFNELEEGRVTEDIYVNSITQVYNDCRSRGFKGRVITGGLLNLSRSSLNFYKNVLKRMPGDTGPMGLTVGFHDYPYGTQTGGRKPWPGTGATVMAGLEELIGYAKGRDVANTEFGWHTMPEEEGFWIWKRKVQLTDEQAYTYLVRDMRRYSVHGLVLACMYQWRDGPEKKSYGLHTAEGVPKRQLDAVRDWKLAA